MEFNKNRPIYLQIADYILEQIILDIWQVGERIPSVRELGGAIEVNPNTVMRAFKDLEERNIIYNKRGIGYFVSSDAIHLITKNKKTQFLNDDLPALFNKMELLGLELKDIVEIYKKRKG